MSQRVGEDQVTQDTDTAQDNGDYIIIKRYIDPDFQEVLFEHTRKLNVEYKVIETSRRKTDDEEGRRRDAVDYGRK